MSAPASPSVRPSVPTGEDVLPSPVSPVAVPTAQPAPSALLSPLDVSVVDDLSRPVAPAWLAAYDDLQGRYTFPESDPSNCRNWTRAKWAETMSLPAFRPTHEVELEAWADTVVPSLENAGPCARTFSGVLLSLAGAAYKGAFQGLCRTPVLTLEDLIDRIALLIFPPSDNLEQLELNVLRPPRSESSLEAHAECLSRFREYWYLCSRRSRPSFLTEALACTSLLFSVPLVVEHRVRDHHTDHGVYATTLTRCQQAEASLRARNGGILPLPSAPMAYPVENVD
jgi:hypothetical protein